MRESNQNIKKTITNKKLKMTSYNLVLIGAPGSGKGTQALKLVKSKNFLHLSTGDIFRENIKKQTELGLLAKSYIDKGDLVPDSVTQDMIRDFIKNISQERNIIWDGFPRNLTQAEAFQAILEEKKWEISQVIYFKISDEKVIQRLSGRLYAPQSGLSYHKINKPPKKEGCCDVSGEALISRSDDKEEVMQSRLKVFYKQTEPLLNYYKKKKLLIELDADLKPEQLSKKLLKLLP